MLLKNVVLPLLGFDVGIPPTTFVNGIEGCPSSVVSGAVLEPHPALVRRQGRWMLHAPPGRLHERRLAAVVGVRPRRAGIAGIFRCEATMGIHYTT